MEIIGILIVAIQYLAIKSLFGLIGLETFFEKINITTFFSLVFLTIYEIELFKKVLRKRTKSEDIVVPKDRSITIFKLGGIAMICLAIFLDYIGE